MKKTTPKKPRTSKTAIKKSNKNIQLSQAVLITGASSGIGEAFAWRYSKMLFSNKSNNGNNKNKPTHLILVARRTKLLNALKASIIEKYETTESKTSAALSSRIIVITESLERPQAASKLMAKIKKAKLHVNTLVNNAGFGDTSLFAQSSLKKNEEMVALNVTTLSLLMQECLPGMQQRGYGRIINVASVGGFMPGPQMATYFATKAYVLSLSVAVRQEVINSGVHITALCPGPVATEFYKASNSKFSAPKVAVITSNQVAIAAIYAVEKNKTHVVPGIFNKIMVAFSKFLSQKMLAIITGETIKKNKVK